MRFNHDRLRGLMREKRVSIAELAKCIGISANSLGLKLRGIRQFTIREMQLICHRLDIAIENVGYYFFEF